MCGQLPLFSRKRCTVRHPGTGQVELFPVHILPHCRCECKLCMWCSDKADICFIARKFKCHMHSRDLSCRLEHIAISLFPGKCHCFLHIIFFRCIDDCICTQTFCQFQTLLADVKYHNFSGAENLCPLHGEHSDRSTA